MLDSRTPLLLCASFLLAACGDADRAEPADGDAFTATMPAAEPPTDAGAGADRGTGTLRIGETTYEFTNRICDFSGETDDDMLQTLVGRGTTADGEQFDVFASRNETGGMLVHTVSLQIGDIRAGTGQVIEASRMRHGENWMSTRGGAAEPLIRIDGDRLTASGTFAPAEGTAAGGGAGVLEATCS